MNSFSQNVLNVRTESTMQQTWSDGCWSTVASGIILISVCHVGRNSNGPISKRISSFLTILYSSRENAWWAFTLLTHKYGWHPLPGKASFVESLTNLFKQTTLCPLWRCKILEAKSVNLELKVVPPTRGWIWPSLDASGLRTFCLPCYPYVFLNKGELRLRYSCCLNEAQLDGRDEGG